MNNPYVRTVQDVLNQEIVDRLRSEIKNLPKCFSKECMGCEIDMQRHILNRILNGVKPE